MPTAGERQALAFLTAVSLVGGGARFWQNRHLDAALQSATSSSERAMSSGEGVDQQLAAVDGARLRNRNHARDKASTVPQMVDVNVANAEALEKLPRIGEALAKRIVANRDSFGSFSGIDDLARVRGVGPSVRELLTPHVTFSNTPSPDASPTITDSQFRSAHVDASQRKRRTPAFSRGTAGRQKKAKAH